MARAFISAGSNIDPEKNVLSALRLLGMHARIRAISTAWLTEPIGMPGHPLFYNCVVEVETDLPPRELKINVLRRIEAELGRAWMHDKYAPRTIDLDLILYDEVVTASGQLVLPDPDIATRPFLAAGIAELAPGLVLPGSGSIIDDIAARQSKTAMKPLADYTNLLRKEILHE